MLFESLQVRQSQVKQSTLEAGRDFQMPPELHFLEPLARYPKNHQTLGNYARLIFYTFFFG